MNRRDIHFAHQSQSIQGDQKPARSDELMSGNKNNVFYSLLVSGFLHRWIIYVDMCQQT